VVIVQEYGSPVTGVQLLDQPPNDGAGAGLRFGVVKVTVTPTGTFAVHREAEAPGEQLIAATIEVPPGKV
jgi:hypothetical protein